MDFFRGRYSWRKLALLVRNLRLSDRSVLVQEQADDPEHAAWVLSLPERPDPPPPISDWTPDHAMLVEIRDGLAQLIAVTAVVAGEKYRAPKPSRRPVTAVAKARVAQRNARHSSLVAEVKAAQQRWAEANPDT